MFQFAKKINLKNIIIINLKKTKLDWKVCLIENVK